MLSNVRGDSGFGTGLQQAQVQTPRPDIKMPPVGNFAPPSATKENKKRRGGPGSQMTGGAAAIDTGAGPSGLNNRNGGARGNANKVSDYLLLSRWKKDPYYPCTCVFNTGSVQCFTTVFATSIYIYRRPSRRLHLPLHHYPVSSKRRL